LRRFRSVVPNGNFRKIDKALRQADSTDTMVLAFIGGTEVVQASQLLHPEYLEADNAHHHEAKGKFQNILFSSSLAASLLIWGALKIHGFTLDPYVSQFFQLGGLGLLSMGAAVALANRLFGPSYYVFLERVIDSLFRPTRPALYFGHTISGTDRRAQYELDILFAHSEVPAMAQRDIFEDLPENTPVMVVIIRPK
jgi:hypothetical protein